MKATEGKFGRVFILHFDDGDEIPGVIEKFAEDTGITAAYVAFSGGLINGEIAAGTPAPYARPFQPCAVAIDNANTASAAGLLISDANGKPHLQLNGVCGYQEKTVAGSLRPGLKVWGGGEAAVYEIVNAACQREVDAATGMARLRPAAAPAHSAPVSAAAEPAFVHVGDHTHLLYLFNAELN